MFQQVQHVSPDESPTSVDSTTFEPGGCHLRLVRTSRPLWHLFWRPMWGIALVLVNIFIFLTALIPKPPIAVLLQEDSAGEKRPIAFASRKLQPRETRYSTIEKECLAIVWGTAKFQEYLYGTEFILETDHSPLQYLRQAKFQNGRLMRWDWFRLGGLTAAAAAAANNGGSGD